MDFWVRKKSMLPIIQREIKEDQRLTKMCKLKSVIWVTDVGLIIILLLRFKRDNTDLLKL